MRLSSNKLLRANGDGVVIVEGCRVLWINYCHNTAADVTPPLSRVTIPPRYDEAGGAAVVPCIWVNEESYCVPVSSLAWNRRTSNPRQ